MSLKVGVVGATGLVGEIFLRLLTERKTPVKELRLFASDRSKGTTINFAGQSMVVRGLEAGAFRGLDVVFFSSGDDVSQQWAPVAVNEGAFAIDNSAAFRQSEGVPLIVPEVNGDLLKAKSKPWLIANPNCSTIQLVLALHPLQQAFGVERVHVASYQSVSGAGRAGQDELAAQLAAWVNQSSAPAPQTFPHPIAMNVIPQIGSIDGSGFCSEEQKIMRETRKILRSPKLKVSAFTVRVPAWNGHSEAVWVQLQTAARIEAVMECLQRQTGLKLFTDTYPLATMASQNNWVGVGRVHQDLDDPNTVLLWVVADNLRKGAAWNGLQIAESLFDITRGA